MEPSDDVGVRCQTDLRLILPLVRQEIKHVAQTFQSRGLLVVRLDDDPGAEGRMGFAEHFFFISRVRIPQLLRLFIDGAELPLLEGILPARFESTGLFFLGNREPELDDRHAVLVEHVLEFRHLLQESLMLLLAAKPHHRFDDGAVVPTAIEKNDLTLVGQLPDLALEIPLAPFIVRRLR